jgi:ATP-dependent DNA helicase RecG
MATKQVRAEVDMALAQVSGGTFARELESSTLDFKEEGRSREDTLRELASAALCFANASGGALVVGVADKQAGAAAFVGTALDALVLRKRIHELSVPPLLVEVEERMQAGVRLLVIFVPQSFDIHADPQGRAPRRLGRDCLPMSPREQALLREERQDIDWSAHPSGRSLDDVSSAALAAARQGLTAFTDERRKYAQLRDRDLLSALGVLSPTGELLRAGELLFCPTNNAPALLYQYRQTPGGEPRAIERINTPLVLAFERVLTQVHARRNLTPVSLPNGQQIDIADFPEVAVREAIANAIIHRDYHLAGPVVVEHSPEVFIVTSPGPLVSGVTPENILTHPSKPRNPTLARAARLLGFAEEVGRGVDRMYREMIRSGRSIPRFEAAFDQVRVLLVGGAPNTQIARFVAQLPEQERDDTDTMLILFRLCSSRTITAMDMAPLLQKTVDEAEASLRRMASDAPPILEATRQTLRRAHPTYRLRGEVLKALGSAVSYQRRTMDEIDRKVIAHVREYGKVTNRTLQNFFDVGVQRARDILADMVHRQLLVKISTQQRGPLVEYGPGPKFPGKVKPQPLKPSKTSEPKKTKRSSSSRTRPPETLPLPLGEPPGRSRKRS